MTARILLVEDDLISQQIIQGVLEAKGYTVDAVASGFDAVQQLRHSRYDLALVDYHMPDLDGLASAKLLDAMSDGVPPKLVAITADSLGLQGREGASSIFDAILTKPIQPGSLLDQLERLLRDPEREQKIAASRALWIAAGLDRRPRALAIPSPSFEQALALGLCFDEPSEHEPADIILLIDAHRTDDVARLRVQPKGSILPVIDMTGTLGNAADGSYQITDPASWNEVAGTIRRFAMRAAMLNVTDSEPADVGASLMTYLAVAERAMTPVMDGNRKTFVHYTGFFPEQIAIASAERLADKGMLRKRFVDRFNVCGECASHRLNVREECPSCRSSNQIEVPLLHHFKCAWQGPDAEFQVGEKLVCPKCRQNLQHYGTDYERSGTIFSCGECAQTCDEPAIGFVCIDCGAHTDGDAVSTQDIFEYQLTPLGLSCVSTPMLTYTANVPGDVSLAVARLKTDATIAAGAIAVAEIIYGNHGRAAEIGGNKRVGGLRKLFLENLRNAVKDVAQVVADAEGGDYIIFHDTSVNEVTTHGAVLLQQCEIVLAEPIGARLRLIDKSAAA